MGIKPTSSRSGSVRFGQWSSSVRVWIVLVSESSLRWLLPGPGKLDSECNLVTFTINKLQITRNLLAMSFRGNRTHCKPFGFSSVWYGKSCGLGSVRQKIGFGLFWFGLTTTSSSSIRVRLIPISNLQCSGSIGNGSVCLESRSPDSSVVSVVDWRRWKLQRDVSTVDWAVHHHATCLDARRVLLIALCVWPASYECADTVSGPPCRQLASQDAASSSSFSWVPVRLQHDTAGNIDAEKDRLRIK